MEMGIDTAHVIEEKDFIIDKRVTMLQYINTALLTLILGLASMIAVTITTVKKEQSTMQVELIRLKTVQDMNVAAVKSLDTRVGTLELNYTNDLKSWVDDNYVRKPQK